MTVEILASNWLKTRTAVTALVPAARIYQLKLPQTPTLPAIRVQLIANPKTYHLRGPQGLERARVQIDVYVSETMPPDPYGKAGEIADAIDGAMGGVTFTVSGIKVQGAFRIDRRALYEDAVKAIRIQQDFRLVARAA